jgi:catechol 2,3-dioxygenase-like lactoylglutathione lyase family enzyme
MIVGAHAILYSKDAEADRAFLRDVLGFPSVDAGGGWLVFGLPPSEVAIHPSDENDVHELYLLCDDVRDLVRSLEEKKIVCSPVREERWGSLVQVSLPGGGRLGIYEPRHPRPPVAGGRAARRKAKKAPAKAKARSGSSRARKRRG